MKLENLKGFDWYNEPENVIFNGEKMTIVAKPATDFWQSRGHGFAKDNGHFFYRNISGDFTMLVKWSFADVSRFRQCGIMLRKDCENWFKVSLMCPDITNLEIGHCLAFSGNSDWSVAPLAGMPSAVWYKVVRQNADYVVLYSLDGVCFTKLRQFYLAATDIWAGVYICNPGKDQFQAVLEDIAFY